MAEPSPSLDAGDLAQGPFSYMQMLLQKTILRVNVATVEVRLDKPTQSRLAGLATGQAYSAALDQQLANVIVGAQRAVVQTKFKRDISLDRYLGLVREGLERARKAGLVTAELERHVSEGLPPSFAAIKSRGYEKGDRIIYSISPEGLHTIVISAGGQVLVDRIDKDQTKKVVLSIYFAGGSEFREPLLRSFFAK
jgi:hypothetical protein